MKQESFRIRMEMCTSVSAVKRQQHFMSQPGSRLNKPNRVKAKTDRETECHLLHSAARPEKPELLKKKKYS
ncbi:hypothetical protein INR49_026239 [Caranx melampygus]|nr:hypothetical protein INR49_026239 [Caranx melampygus]